MKKHVYPVIALSVLLVASSCNKNDDSGTPNTFKINSTTYTATTITRAGSTSTISAAGGGALISLTFNTLPTANGTFKVGNEIAILARDGNDYVTQGNDNISATVTVNNGKLTIHLPDTWALLLPAGGDSVKISADLREQ